MLDEPEALRESEISRCAADLAKLCRLIEGLREKIGAMDAKYCSNPEFVTRSLISIYDSQAVLANRMARVLVTLRDGIVANEGAQEPHLSEPPRKASLRLVEPDDRA